MAVIAASCTRNVQANRGLPESYLAGIPLNSSLEHSQIATPKPSVAMTELLS